MPAVMVRLHKRLWRLLWLWALQMPLDLAPARSWVKVKLTLAFSFSVNEKVVPIGIDVLLAVSLASLLPSLQREWDWRRPESLGAGLAAIAGGASVGAIASV